MRILVTGALGFIGAHTVAALHQAGHDVVRGVRAPRAGEHGGAQHDVACDFARDTTADIWLPRLQGIDAVVNIAGILREGRGASFNAVHVETPHALADACARCGIARFVQVSALGRAHDGEFIASKHRGDEAVLRALPTAVILRPGLVYSARGAYGGTALLRGLAALPLCIPLPEGGRQSIQPLCVDDLTLAVLAAIDRSAARGQVFELAGPEVMTLRDYVLAWRRWLGFGRVRILSVPAMVVDIAATLGERFSRGPVGRTMTRILSGGVVAAPTALEQMREQFGLAPRSLADSFALPAQPQDRWSARLYFVVPLLIAALVAVWIASGLIGLLLPAAEIDTMMASAHWPASLSLGLARIGGAVDLALGVALAVRPRSVVVLLAMLAQAAIYTVVLSLVIPSLWLDPWGGMLKNLLVIPALLVALATAERR